MAANLSDEAHKVHSSGMFNEQVVPRWATFKNAGVTAPFFLYLVLISIAAPSIVAQQPTLVSVNQSGTGSGNGDSNITDVCVSADGRFVAFASNAPDLVPVDANGTWDVFVRDLQTGTTTLVSVNATGTGSGNEQSGVTGSLSIPTYAISGDGRFVSFSSEASDLAANDTNGLEDIFVRDLQAGTTSLVTISAAGTASGNGASIFSSITLDGSTVSFRSNANDLVANDTNGTTDVFVRRLNTGSTFSCQRECCRDRQRQWRVDRKHDQRRRSIRCLHKQGRKLSLQRLEWHFQI